MRRPKQVMARIKEQCRSLIEANPTLSLDQVARHYGVTAPTVSRWVDEWGLKRWFC
ncbi:MAG: hypothetical protein WC712_14950 [Candidatus Brocadiia bacterium]